MDKEIQIYIKNKIKNITNPAPLTKIEEILVDERTAWQGFQQGKLYIKDAHTKKYHSILFKIEAFTGYEDDEDVYEPDEFPTLLLGDLLIPLDWEDKLFIFGILKEVFPTTEIHRGKSIIVKEQ